MKIMQGNSVTQDWLDFNFCCVGNIHFVDEECLTDGSVTLVHYSEHIVLVLQFFILLSESNDDSWLVGDDESGPKVDDADKSKG